MQVIQAEAGGVGFLDKNQYDLSEVVTDEAVLGIAGETAERESNQFL
jgi:hypothetical protein